VFPSYNALETRTTKLTLPRLTIQGAAHLAGNAVTTARGQLARFAATGNAFLLGLPHEALSLTANASGATVFANAAALAAVDWNVPGQRVLVVTGDASSSVVGVIQSSTSSSITLNLSPGSIGNYGGFIMPAVPVYLDAKQGFQRYAKSGSVEMWQLAARNIMFGYESGADVSAFVSLAQFTGSILTPATLVWKTPGSAPNGIQLNVVNTGGNGVLSVDSTGRLFTWHFSSGVTTMGQFLDAVAANGSFGVSGSGLSRSSVFTTLNDNGIIATFAGGTDKNWGTMGNGATVTQYQGRAVWDRGIAAAQAGDSLQGLTDLIDLGGAVALYGTATQPDWGRSVAYERELAGDSWQWLKAFIYQARGRQKAWWYPTWRADLSAVSLAPGTLTINGSVGDYSAWYPRQRQYLMLVDSTGATQYLQITGAVSAGGGNVAFAITSSNTAYNTGGGGATLSAGQIALVSWLDLCRFDSDDFDVTFSGVGFSFQAQARAVAQ
jgi:hypothetical protein